MNTEARVKESSSARVSRSAKPRQQLSENKKKKERKRKIGVFYRPIFPPPAFPCLSLSHLRLIMKESTEVWTKQVTNSPPPLVALCLFSPVTSHSLFIFFLFSWSANISFGGWEPMCNDVSSKIHERGENRRLHSGLDQPKTQMKVPGLSLIGLLVCLFTPTAHSFACSALLALLALSAALTHSLARSRCSLPRSWDSEWLDGYFSVFFSLLDHSATIAIYINLPSGRSHISA